MGDTKIEWTDKSWNPIAAYYAGKRGWMCSKPSAGCKNCYSERMNLRLGNGLLYTAENAQKVEFRLVNLDEPGTWKKPQKCFVESMGDLFHEAIPEEMIGHIWSKMLEFPQHRFQVLTKRANRMRNIVTRLWEEGAEKGLRSPDHIWIGVSVENQEQVDKRIPDLLATPAAVHFLSCEPLLGPVNLEIGFHDADERPLLIDLLDWVICGGESGPGARPMNPEWARNLRDQCARWSCSYHFKQWGEWAPMTQAGFGDYPKAAEHVFSTGQFDNKGVEFGIGMRRIGKKAAGRLLDGVEHNEFPAIPPPVLAGESNRGSK